MTDVKYVADGRDFISYKEEQEALKALEIMNMGTKFHVDIDRQPVKKNETEKRIQNEVQDSFIYLRICPKTKLISNFPVFIPSPHILLILGSTEENISAENIQVYSLLTPKEICLNQ